MAKIKTEFEKLLGNGKMKQLWNVFAKVNAEKHFTAADIQTKLGATKNEMKTISKHWVELGLMNEVGIECKSKVYEINRKSEVVKGLQKLFSCFS
jgi:hypothetical protein